MKKLLTLVLTALVLFAVSATASWLLMRMKSPDAEPDKEAAHPAGEGKIPLAHGAAAQPTTATGTQRVAVKAPYSPGTDEAAQLANNLRGRLASLSERENELAARQKQLELIRQDIRGERAAIDELRKQVNEEMKASEERLSAAERKYLEAEEYKKKMSSDVKDMEGRMLRMGELENGNVQKMAEMIDTMDAASAAKILQQLADTGKMETAVKLLALMKGRQASKVLAEFADPALAAQLLEKLKSLERTPSPPKQ